MANKIQIHNLLTRDLKTTHPFVPVCETEGLGLHDHTASWLSFKAKLSQLESTSHLWCTRFVLFILELYTARIAISLPSFDRVFRRRGSNMEGNQTPAFSALCMN